MTIVIMSFVFAAALVSAEALDVMTIVNKTEEALSVGRAGTRKVVITVKNGDRITSEWVARGAHKQFGDGIRSLMVLLEPESLKGISTIFWRPDEKTISEWVYIPATRRVRKLSGATVYDSFFGTDFTYADFGFKEPGGTYRLLGEEIHAGKKAYKIKIIPRYKWYYSRIVSWIAIDSYIPIQRNYYDSAGSLWKTKLFKDVVVVNNIPMPLRIRMLDVLNNHSTEVSISDVCYDVDYLPKEVFDPEKLPEVTLSPVCTVKAFKKN